MTRLRATTTPRGLLCLPWLPAIVLALVAPLHAASSATGAPAVPAYTAEQQAALDALDSVIARFDTLLARDDDARHKAATKAVLDDFKQRRAAIRQAFDQSRYDELRVDLNLEYQRLASWMAQPTTPPPAPRPPDDRRRR